jgi:hypothetical protein
VGAVSWIGSVECMVSRGGVLRYMYLLRGE